MKINKWLTVLATAALMSGTAVGAPLVVGTEATFAPFEFTDDAGKIIGFDAEIAQAVAAEMGVDLEIRNMPFDGLIPALMTSQIDAVMAAMTITEERQKKVDFSDPYYKSGLSAVILKENAYKFKKISDLRGQKICVQIGTTGALNAADITEKVSAFNTAPEAFMELHAKGCVAVLNDRPVNLYFLSKDKSGAFTEVTDLLNAEQYGIAVRKGDADRLAMINEGLRRLRANGKFAQIHKKWFSVAE